MIIEEMLKLVPEDMVLGESPQPWVGNLIKAVNDALVSDEINLECLTEDSTGKDLREALRSLPAATQIALLNDNVISFGRRRRRQEDVKKDQALQIEHMERKFKFSLIRYAVLTFLFLAVIFVLALIFISYKQETPLDSTIATGLFSTTLEIIKLIFSGGK